MFDDLKYTEFVDQFQVPDNEEKKADMKQHEKDPQEGVVSSNGWQEERVVKCP